MGKLSACVLLSLFVIGGCGGKTERSSDPGQSSGSGGAASDGGDDEWPASQLGECVPGKPQASAPSCPWIAAGICYPDKAAACNCVCPKNHDSICMSDFPEPGVPTEVSCF